MATDTPFGQATRMAVLNAYLEVAGELTPENAWTHVYRCLLWMNVSAGLAHIYDSNHMQPGGGFHGRAIRFTEELCRLWNTDRPGMASQLDVLFKGCVAELRRQTSSNDSLADPVLESELIAEIQKILEGEGLQAEQAERVSRLIESMSRLFFTTGNKRKNALGEGFEDLLAILLERVSQIPPANLALRRPVSKLPGFRRAAPVLVGQKQQREPKPDVAIIENDITHVIVTAKWSTRQDRETQFQSEYVSIQNNKIQSTELRYVLITNEFDIARLRNVARAFPGGEGGFVFHNIYHISLPLLEYTQGEQRFAEIRPYVQTGKIRSLSDFFLEMRGRFGQHL